MVPVFRTAQVLAKLSGFGMEPEVPAGYLLKARDIQRLWRDDSNSLIFIGVSPVYCFCLS
jgi:hypothetical protein